jgi:hypothetical protein
MIQALIARLIIYEALLAWEPSMFLAILVVFPVYDKRIYLVVKGRARTENACPGRGREGESMAYIVP